MRVVPVVAALLLVSAGVAQAAPAGGDEHVFGTAAPNEVGGTTLRVYGTDGSVATESNRGSRTLRFGTADSTGVMVSGASRAGAGFLFDGLDLDVDNPDGTRTLTLGIGPAESTSVAPLHLTVHGGEVPIDLTPSGSEIVTMETAADGSVVLRGYPVSSLDDPHVLAVYPATLGGLGSVGLVQYAGALRFGAKDIRFSLAYGDDRLYSATAGGAIVSAADGGQFTPLTAPDGSIADAMQLSADGVALIHTPTGYWLVKQGQFTQLPAAWFTDLTLSSGALAPGGSSFAFGISAPKPSVPTQVITVDLASGARRTYSLLDVTLPTIAGLAYSVVHPGRLYLLRNSHFISPHQPVTTQLQALDLATGTPSAIGNSIPEYAPRLFTADVG